MPVCVFIMCVCLCVSLAHLHVSQTHKHTHKHARTRKHARMHTHTLSLSVCLSLSLSLSLTHFLFLFVDETQKTQQKKKADRRGALARGRRGLDFATHRPRGGTRECPAAKGLGGAEGIFLHFFFGGSALRQYNPPLKGCILSVAYQETYKETYKGI